MKVQDPFCSGRCLTEPVLCRASGRGARWDTGPSGWWTIFEADITFAHARARALHAG